MRKSSKQYDAVSQYCLFVLVTPERLTLSSLFTAADWSAFANFWCHAYFDAIYNHVLLQSNPIFSLL